MKTETVKNAAFKEVHRLVSAGCLISTSTAENNVSRAGYVKWRERNGIKTSSDVVPCSVFKAVEKEIKANETHALCARFGISAEDFWNRKKVVKQKRISIQKLQAIFSVHEIIKTRPTTAQICENAGITLSKLYSWRKSTGGIQK